MKASDAAYFQLRAERERQLADEATNPAAALAHRTMANAYEARMRLAAVNDLHARQATSLGEGDCEDAPIS